MANRGQFGLPTRGVVNAARGGQEAFAPKCIANGVTVVDLAAANVFQFELGGSVTFAFVGALPGRACSATLLLTQDATGSRAITWPSSVKWLPAGSVPAFTTTANTHTVIEMFTVDGGIIWFAGLAGTGIA